MSSIAYAVCTISMVLSNKAISAYNSAEVRARIPPFFVVFYQSVFAVAFLEILKRSKCIEYEDFTKRDAIAVLPLSILFVGMIVSGFMAISYINVPLMTVFKNMTNLVTMSAEWYLFNEQITSLMVVSATPLARMSVSSNCTRSSCAKERVSRVKATGNIASQRCAVKLCHRTDTNPNYYETFQAYSIMREEM